jgi:hypothetical protein
MIMRGGGATGAEGLGAAAGCICVTLLGRWLAALGVLPGTPLGAASGAAVVADGGVARGGTAVIGGVALVEIGVPATGGVRGVFGGITTTDGGR